MSEQDWTNGTWRGSRLQQHRRFQALTFREKMSVMEDLAEVARRMSGVRPLDRQPESDKSP
ncbi:MAG: hypothetical protein ABIS27_11200 [Longimicrobiales bacterium]